MIEVIRECWENRYRLYTLSVYDLKVRNSGTWFGAFWNVLNPALQIFVYWFVFAIGLRTSAPQGEHSYLIWMLMGIIPWFYISEAMNGCMSAIFAFQGVLKHMRFPVAIVPVKTVLTALINHLLMLAVFVVGGFVSTILCHLLRGKAIFFALIPLAIVLVDFLHADLKTEKAALDRIPRGH